MDSRSAHSMFVLLCALNSQCHVFFVSLYIRLSFPKVSSLAQRFSFLLAGSI